VVWSKELRWREADVLEGQNELIEGMVGEVSAAIIARELERTQSQASPTLENYTLLIGAINLMHRLSLHDFNRAREMLQVLTERSPRLAIPQAWLAKWHVLRVQQGWSADARADAQLALDCTRRALDSDSHCSLALAIDGFVHTNLMKQLDTAQERYELALDVNPNDSLAWLLKGMLHAFRGEGRQAVRDTQRALRLSPLDPHRYFYDSLAASAALSAGQYDRAVELARRSLRANRTHTSTLRVLAIAQWQLGRHEDARKTARELLRLEPRLTVSRWLERSPSSDYEIGRICAHALKEAGVPE
jgi:tetratricopeptide (TPR) repeat protein